LKLTPVEIQKDLPPLVESSPAFYGGFKRTGNRTASPVLGQDLTPDGLDMTELLPIDLEKAEVMSSSFFGDCNVEFYDSSREISPGKDPIGSPDHIEDPDNLKVVSFMDPGFQHRVLSDETRKESHPAIELEQIPEIPITPEKQTPPHPRRISEVSQEAKTLQAKSQPKIFVNSPGHSQQDRGKFNFDDRMSQDLGRKGIIHPFAVKSQALALPLSRVSLYSKSRSLNRECSKSVSRLSNKPDGLIKLSDLPALQEKEIEEEFQKVIKSNEFIL
jgi:hypothetical protein